METYVIVALIVFAGIFVQTLAGFGSALVIMPLLVPVLGMHKAPPLMSLVAGTLQIVLLIRYWRSLHIRTVVWLSLSSVPSIPIGIWGLRLVDERITLSLLAAVILGYALYALTQPRLPELKSKGWVFAAGFSAGLLGGAYNTNGPPVVIYGNCRRWPPDVFKSNLQGFFLLNCMMILTGHGLKGNLTAEVGTCYLVALPAVALGIGLGLFLDKFIDQDRFKKIVLYLLILLGLRLLARVIFGY
jgi:uncharacterized membrane protein YfcA